MTSKAASATSTTNQKSIATAAATTVISPAILATLILIFGGCCSNVYTLEAILSLSPATGHLITFLQFILTALYKLPSQLSTVSRSNSDEASKDTSFLKQRSVPLKKWLLMSVMFVTINILNNAAFGYKISLPLHIILRSAGPVTSMILGYSLAGKRYTPRKIVAVMLLFIGVVMAALSDANSHNSHSQPADTILATASKITNKVTPTKSVLQEQLPGFILLTLALLLSAVMGIYSDALYSIHGRSSAIADEQLFYCHTLSLPFFAAQHDTLRTQYNALLTSSASIVDLPSSSAFLTLFVQRMPGNLSQYLPELKVLTSVPVLLLLANAITQIMCISGVHKLSTQTSSLTVSIVLNVRKLVSLLLSIWLFGNRLPVGVALGAAVVFIGGGLYGMPESKTKNHAKDQERSQNSEAKKSK